MRAKIASSFKGQYSLLGANDFDFVKVTQKRILVLRLGENTEYNYGDRARTPLYSYKTGI